MIYDKAEAARLIAKANGEYQATAKRGYGVQAGTMAALAESLRAADVEIERLTSDVTAAQVVAREADRRAEGRTALLAAVERLQAAADVTRRAAVVYDERADRAVDRIDSQSRRIAALEAKIESLRIEHDLKAGDLADALRNVAEERDREQEIGRGLRREIAALGAEVSAAIGRRS